MNPCLEKYETNNEFWQRIEKLPVHFKPESPIIIQNKMLFPNAGIAQKQMFSSCNKIAPVMSQCLENQADTVLDLGCGLGINAYPLLKRGSKVILYEKDRDLLEKVLLNVKNYGDKVILRRGDITGEKPFIKEREKVDAILCIDVLPYLPPNSLRKTLQKIHDALSEDGYFYGTIFVNTPITRGVIVETMGKLGACFINTSKDAKSLLIRSGFDLLHFSMVEENNGYQFIARKTSLD